MRELAWNSFSYYFLRIKEDLCVLVVVEQKITWHAILLFWSRSYKYDSIVIPTKQIYDEKTVIRSCQNVGGRQFKRQSKSRIQAIIYRFTRKVGSPLRILFFRSRPTIYFITKPVSSPRRPLQSRDGCHHENCLGIFRHKFVLDWNGKRAHSVRHAIEFDAVKLKKYKEKHRTICLRKLCTYPWHKLP